MIIWSLILWVIWDSISIEVQRESKLNLRWLVLLNRLHLFENELWLRLDDDRSIGILGLVMSDNLLQQSDLLIELFFNVLKSLSDLCHFLGLRILRDFFDIGRIYDLYRILGLILVLFNSDILILEIFILRLFHAIQILKGISFLCQRWAALVKIFIRIEVVDHAVLEVGFIVLRSKVSKPPFCGKDYWWNYIFCVVLVISLVVSSLVIR